MPNPDCRAEISSLPEAVVIRKDQGRLPRWARVPQSVRMAGAVANFGVRFLGVILAANSDSLLGVSGAQAAGPKCTGTVEVLGFKYADRFDIDGSGRENIIDPTDYDLGDDVFHGVNLLNKDKKPFNPPKKENMIPQGNYSRATFPITPKDNLDCTTADSLELYVQFERDEKALVRVILPNRQKIFHVGGKKEADPGALTRIASGERPLKQVRTSVEEIVKNLTGHTLSLVSPEDMRADNSEQNKKALMDYAVKGKTNTPSPGKSGSGANPDKKQGGVPVAPMAAGGVAVTGLLALIYRFLPKVPHWTRWGHKII